MVVRPNTLASTQASDPVDPVCTPQTQSLDSHADWGDDDIEQRLLRQAEREDERTQSRHRAGLSRPLKAWSRHDKADLDFDVLRSPMMSNPPARRQSLPAATINPFGSRQPLVGPRPDPFGHFDGMGRPRLDQVSSSSLTTAQAASAYKRILCGNAMALVFSVHVTICWSLVGVHLPSDIHAGLRKVFAVLRDTNRRNGARGYPPLAWIWTMERSVAKGQHTHILLACAPHRRKALLQTIARAVRNYIHTSQVVVTAEQIPAKSQNQIDPAQPNYAIAMTSPRPRRDGGVSPSREIRAQWALWRYIFKGVESTPWDGKTAIFRSLARSPQGMIVGQRWGFSTATLGDAAWGRYARSVGGDADVVDRFIARMAMIQYPEGIDNYSPIWSASFSAT